MASKPKSMRGIILSDTHCGHMAGLTPPDHNSWMESDESGQPLSKSMFQDRANNWRWFEERVRANRPKGGYDFCLANGDLVDGKGRRSGSTELIYTDRMIQAKVAAAVLDAVGAKEYYLSYGTPYHTGDEEDWETAVAELVSAKKVGGHDWVDVNGLIIDYKHHIGGSTIPHGRHTAAAREYLWNERWASKGFPLADMVVRSHVHYFNFCGGDGWVAMTTPALQGLGSKYGTRRASGTVDFGFVVVDVTSKEDWRWWAELMPWPKVEATKVGAGRG